MSKFWTYTQNNSGGSFDFNLERGITHHVIIEAETADQASTRARNAGIYFDGVHDGQDCPCCGDRWSEPWRDEGTYTPEVYGKSPAEFMASKDRWTWMDPGREICVHYLDGRKEWA